MKFDMSEWIKFYNNVHLLGRVLRDSQETILEDGGVTPPIHELSKDAQLNLRKQIKTLLKKSSEYLDSCKFYPRVSLWYHDKYDPSTWASHESFKFKNLLNARRYK